jgi:two-component system chemotaxis response regulator CheY
MADAREEVSVLIVDDSEHVRALLAMLLRKEGISKIHQAMDGEAAVAKYKELRPSIVFLDNMLPKLSGLEALKQIIAFDPAAKVIMISAISTTAVVQEARELGASYYLIKPYGPQKVIEVMKKILNLPESQPS